MEKKISTYEDQLERQQVLSSSPSARAITIPYAMSIAGRIGVLLSAMRPRQWTKNFAVFVGLVFSQRLLSLPSLDRAVVAFITFCLASSSIYLLNDLLDLEKDRQHPVKSQRALASGRLPVSWAIAAIGILVLACAGGVSLVFYLPVGPQSDIFAPLGGGSLLFALCVASYMILMVLYTLRLKHVVLLDVFIIAAGFVLRILAGTVVIPVRISPWLYLVTVLLSLFLALSKRRHELVLLQEQASKHRTILKEYSLPMLDQMITIVLAGTLMAYSLYTFQGVTGNHHLMATIPVVLYGVFRYLYLIYMRMEGGSPEEVLLRDRHVLGSVIVCTLIIIVVLYLLPR